MSAGEGAVAGGGGRYPARALLRLVLGPALLVALALVLDLEAVWARLVGLDPAWAALALGLSCAQVALSAWRWRYTAGRLGLDLPFGTAYREYYLAVFVNQVLPGGVVGDASRAWRHARSDAGTGRGRAVRAVLLERGSGQAMMAVAAAVSLVLAGPPLLAGAGLSIGWAGAALVVGACALVWAVARLGVWLGRKASPVARLGADARRALLAGSALPVQVFTSTLIVGSYIATYVIAARAVGITTPMATLAPLVAPVLLSMLIPVTVAGWGVREGTAAGVWGLAGLGAADGIAISVAYGVLVLVGTLPGAAVLVRGAYRPGGDVPPRDAPTSRSKRMSAPIRK